MNSLLGYLVPWLTSRVEDTATEALAFILNRSESCRGALESLVVGEERDFDFGPITKLETQVSDGDGARPDLVGFDGEGHRRLVVESKFWAALREGQANSYFGQLDETRSGALLFVAGEDLAPTLTVSAGQETVRRRRRVMTADNPERSASSAMVRWEQAVDVPLLVLALASIPLIVLEDTSQDAVALTATVANWAIWGLFAVDLAVRVGLARGHRRKYLTSHWYDVGIVVLSVLPYFRPLRILRSARALRVLRAARVTVYATSIRHMALRLWGGLAGRAVIMVIPVILAAGSAGVWLLEKDSNGAIDHYGDAAWWAITTVTTVGYGDIAPVTTEGRLIAAVLMITGIAAFGVVTANVAAGLTRQRQPEQDISNRLEELQAAIDDLRQQQSA